MPYVLTWERELHGYVLMCQHTLHAQGFPRAPLPHPPAENSFISSHLEKSPRSRFPSPPPNFYSLPTISHCFCTIFLFVLISYSFDTQVTLILILIDVQYSQNPVFSFEKGSSRQNHSSVSHHLIKKSPPTLSKFPVPHPHWGGDLVAENLVLSSIFLTRPVFLTHVGIRQMPT